MSSDRMTVNGIELEVLRRGAGSPVLLLHGMDTVHPRAPFLDRLGRDAEIIAPSSPGFGNTKRPADFDPVIGASGAKATLQELFLGAAARESERMTLFLINGVMLQGSITGFDQFSLVLERGGQIQLVYKHAISTLQPANPLSLDAEQDANTEDGAAS